MMAEETVADILADEQEPPQDEAQPTEPVEEVAEEPEVEQVEEVREPQSVPVASMVAERQRRAAAENALAEQNERFSKLTERLDVINERMHPAPDPETEPLESLQHSNKELANEISEIKGMLNNANQVNQTNQYQQQVQAMETQFAQANPDYNDAYQYLVEARMREYDMMGLPNPQESITKEAQWIVANATQAGINPAEVVYNMAVDRGFKNGAKVVAEPQKQTLKETAKNIEEAQTLAAAPGKTLGPDMTTEDLLDMTDEEFDKATSGKNWKSHWQ